MRIASALREACSEFYSDFELSQATRRVALSSPRRLDGRRLLHLMGERALKELLNLEDFLTGSGLPVAESRTLLQHRQQLRWRLRLLGSSDLGAGGNAGNPKLLRSEQVSQLVIGARQLFEILAHCWF